jgi:hypothetical protein
MGLPISLLLEDEQTTLSFVMMHSTFSTSMSKREENNRLYPLYEFCAMENVEVSRITVFICCHARDQGENVRA